MSWRYLRCKSGLITLSLSRNSLRNLHILQHRGGSITLEILVMPNIMYSYCRFGTFWARSMQDVCPVTALVTEDYTSLLDLHSHSPCPLFVPLISSGVPKIFRSCPVWLRRAWTSMNLPPRNSKTALQRLQTVQVILMPVLCLGTENGVYWCWVSLIRSEDLIRIWQPGESTRHVCLLVRPRSRERASDGNK